MTTTTIDLKNHSERARRVGVLPLRALVAAAAVRLGLTRAAPQESALRDLAREAAAVRAMADTYRKTDRGFAADLYAAADRHERAGIEAAADRVV